MVKAFESFFYLKVLVKVNNCQHLTQFANILMLYIKIERDRVLRIPVIQKNYSFIETSTLESLDKIDFKIHFWLNEP